VHLIFCVFNLYTVSSLLLQKNYFIADRHPALALALAPALALALAPALALALFFSLTDLDTMSCPHLFLFIIFLSLCVLVT
jgi:hypothetical protein